MSDTTPQGWFDGAVALLILVFGYIQNLYRGKVDALEISQREFVTREELAELVRDIEATNERRHEQNLDSISNLTGRIDRWLERTK